MTDENAKQESEVTPKGAVSVDEKDLDEVAGGGIVIEDKPTDRFSLNFSKIEAAGQKVAPQVITAAGPGGGPHVVPEKKN